MSKVIKLKESDFHKMVNKVIREQQKHVKHSPDDIRRETTILVLNQLIKMVDEAIKKSQQELKSSTGGKIQKLSGYTPVWQDWSDARIKTVYLIADQLKAIGAEMPAGY